MTLRIAPVVFFTDRHTHYHHQLHPHLTYSRMHQCHSRHVKLISRSPIPQFIDNCDAIITQDRHHILLVKTADCLPVLIYKPPTTIAAIHAGRRGTEMHITATTITTMQTCSPNTTEPWLLWIGPHICSSCYEINPDTHETYDLKQKNLTQIQAQLATEKTIIHTSPYCTVCDNDRYFSYRANGHYSGRFFSGIYLP